MNNSQPNTVYVVLVNRTAIHSICATEQVAQQIAKAGQGLTVHPYPLISKMVDTNTGMTESAEDDTNDQLSNFLSKFTDKSNQQSNSNHEPIKTDEPTDEKSLGGSNMMAEGADIICVDVPLAIRLFEYAREEVEDDATIHELTERLVKLGTEKDEVLTMDHYNDIIADLNGSEGPDSTGQSTEKDMFGDEDQTNNTDDHDWDKKIDDEFGVGQEEDDHLHDFGDEEEPQPQKRFDPRKLGNRIQQESLAEQFKVMTLADFTAPEVQHPDTKVPTIKDLYKQKAGERAKPEYFRSMLIQDPVTTAFVVAPNTTNQP